MIKKWLNATNIAHWSRSGSASRVKSAFAQYILILLYSFDLPAAVRLGKHVRFMHNGLGTVILPNSEIRDDAIVFHNVTLGDGGFGMHNVNSKEAVPKIIIGEGAIICAGAKVLVKGNTLRVGKGTVVGANAVLTQSTGDFEVWAGVPARKIRSMEGAND